MPTRLFGLTGNIASGKSTVARRFAARGVPSLDADRFARDVVAPGTEGLRDVVDAFGPGVLDASGAVDRKALGALVFADPAKRKRLNEITHPRIAAATQAALAALESAGAPLGCYEASLLVENGIADAFRPLVVVLAPEAQQRDWLVRRDGLGEAEALARIGSQLPAAEKARVADFVIENAGSLDALIARADETLDALLDRLGLDRSLYPVPTTSPSLSAAPLSGACRRQREPPKRPRVTAEKYRSGHLKLAPDAPDGPNRQISKAPRTAGRC